MRYCPRLFSGKEAAVQSRLCIENNMKRCYTQNKSKNSRGNLGADIPVLVYRMLEYSLRDAITERFGKDVQVELFRKAGRTAGEYFARHFLDLTLPMNGFVGELQAKMQEQRIGVLRALAASPPIVLMDEPFSALDPLTRESLQDEVKNLQQKLNKTIVFVSHDMSEALKLADIIIFMAAGEIVQMASPEEMLEHPANDLVRTFMGKHTPE